MRRTAVHLTTALAWLGWIASAAGAPTDEPALRFANIFGDHMVLQRGKALTVWGRARPGAQVTVTLTEDRKPAEPYLPEQRPPDSADAYRVTLEVVEHNRPAFTAQTRRAEADAHGDWQVELKPMTASFTPKYLVLTSGGRGVALRDILIGEVWLCAGQSNMVWGNHETKDIELSAPDMPQLRYCRLDASWYKPKRDLDGPARWTPCTAEGRKRMAALPYLVGRDLHRVLGVPVAMINVARGGTTGQTWCTREELEKLDSDLVRKALAAYDAETAKWEREAYRRQVVREWEQACERVRAEHPRKVEQAKAAGKKPPRLRLPRKPGDPRAGWSPPAGMFQATVWPIRKLAVRGALYHQGENNYFAGWTAYEATFPAVIRSFRAACGDAKLPFGIITLPGWGRYDLDAEVSAVGNGYQSVRDIHIRTHEKTPHTGLIAPVQCGNSYIHPADKEPVALLTVRWALAKVYGLEVYHAGPKPRKIEAAGSKMRVFYEVDPLRDQGFEGNKEMAYWVACAVPHTGGGDDVTGFIIAGKDRRWYPAKAKVNQRDRCVEVWSDLVAEPVAVRYDFANWPRGNLVGEKGIPAPPFRSDDWPLPRKVRSEPETGEKIKEMLNVAARQALDRKIRQAMIDIPRWEHDLHMNSRVRPEGNGPRTKLLSKADRLAQVLGEFQDTDDWMRRYIQKANPEVAGKVKQLQAQVEQLKAEIRKMDE